jgi:hypothetical protein
MNDDRLRELYQRGIEARGPGEARLHPTPEALWALVRREGDEAQRLATLDHTMSCPLCRHDLELLRAIASAAPVEAAATAPAAPSSAATRGRARGGHWRITLPAALLAASIAGIAWLGIARNDDVGNEPLRGEPGAVALAAPDESADVTSTPLLAWHPVDGAERYLVEVVDASGEVVDSAELADTTFQAGASAPLAAGDAYRWWVRALDAGGVRAVSPMRTLRVLR